MGVGRVICKLFFRMVDDAAKVLVNVLGGDLATDENAWTLEMTMRRKSASDFIICTRRLNGG